MALTVYSPGDVLTASSLNDNLSFAAAASNDNVVINGAMQVAQRGTSTASITTTGYYTADRFQTAIATMGTWTQTVENDAPTGSGFRKSLKMECTTADASPAAGDQVQIRTVFEGQNLQQFLKGTADAKQFTVSFYVKASETGTYIAELLDADNTRQVSAAYTVVASNTWEEKTITFPADTTGAFDNDNGASLRLDFFLGAGSNLTSGTLNTVWGATVDANRAVGQVNVAGATSRTWQVTGVKLEVGGQETPFPFEDISTTIEKCQRYFFLLVSGSATSFAMGANITATEAQGHVQFPVTMRTAPSLVATSGTDFYDFVRNSADDFFNSVTIVQAGVSGAGFGNNAQISGTAGHAGRFLTNNAGASIAFSAEL